MEKLKLPDVTLVCVETREHPLAALAIQDCIKKADFGEILILTNEPRYFDRLFGCKVHFQIVPDWSEKVGWSRSWWYDVPPLLRTKQTLNIQWDSWIWDASLWRDEWLEYDYVGAPWWYEDGRNVGNGGFSLVSTRLKRFMLKNRGKFPCDTPLDDDLLCRKYRRQLEEYGFRWAPESVAYEFAWEGCRKDRTQRRHFGFHAMFNWPLVLTRDGLIERMRVAAKSGNLTRPGSYQFKTFFEVNSEIAKDVLYEIEPPLKIQENL